METLIDLNCEDVMMELVYKYLLNGNHLMAMYRNKLSDPEPYRDAAVAFIGLRPRCCVRPVEKTRQWVDELAQSGRRVLDFKREDDNRRVNGTHGDIVMNNLVHEVNFDYGVGVLRLKEFYSQKDNKRAKYYIDKIHRIK